MWMYQTWGCVRHVLYYTGYIGVGGWRGWGRWGELDRGGGGGYLDKFCHFGRIWDDLLHHFD